MRKLIVSSIIATAALCVASPAHAQLKVGIVDMTNVFSSYYKTKDAEAKINAQRADAKKDLDTRLEVLKKSMEEINKLNQDIEKQELSKEGKEKAGKQRDEKIAEARNLDREITEYRQTKEKGLQEQYLRMRKDLVDDIMVTVNDKVKTAGYDLVLDKSGLSLAQIPTVLFSRSDMDFSNDIITALNKNAPKPASAAN
jgi:Skp family chaperone for outer membrane proteins